MFEARVQEQVGGGEGSGKLTALLLGSVTAGTLKQYVSRYDTFSQFCEARKLSAFPASENTLLLFLAEVESTPRDSKTKAPVRAETAKGYVTAITTLHTLCREVPPLHGRGTFVNRVLDAWAERDLWRGGSKEARTAIPAEGVERVLLRALEEGATRSTVRGAAALGLGFLYYARGGTLGSLLDHEVCWDADYLLVVCVSKHQTGTVRAARQVRLPRVDNVDVLVRVLEKWTVMRGAPSGRFFNGLGDARMTTTLLAETYRAALREVGVVCQGNYYYGSHSVRSGGASCCKALGIAGVDIDFMGGWAANSPVVDKHYIDRSIRWTSAAERFFGWLLPAQRGPGFALLSGPLEQLGNMADRF